MIANNKPKLTTDADRAIGSRIAALRLAQGLSQTVLGQAVGVSFQQVQKYEKGRNRIGVGRLQAIADVLNVSVETFFVGQPGSEGNGAVATTFFNDPQVTELVMAFTGISDATTRQSVLSIVKAAASPNRKSEATEPLNAKPTIGALPPTREPDPSASALG